MLFGILLIHSVCSSKLDPAVKLLLKVSYDKPEKGIGISFSHFLKQKLDCVPNCSFAVITNVSHGYSLLDEAICWFLAFPDFQSFLS